MRSFPLGGGREILFELPPDLTLRELLKFYCHVAPFAVDFKVPTAAELVAFLRAAAIKRIAPILPARIRQHAILW